MRSQIAEHALSGLTGLSIFILLAMLAFILVTVVHGGASTVSWEFLTASPRKGMTEGGILPAIVGTAFLTLLMTVAAVPAGVATAVYLTEYAPSRSVTARVVRVSIANLAGVPSIVFGLFGLGFFILTMGKGIDGVLYGGTPTYGQPCLLWASLTLAILTLPVVVVSTEEALRAVPRELRDASSRCNAISDHPSSHSPGGGGRDHDGWHPRREPWRGRGGADHVHRRGLLPP
jgi:phosphate transport system permease protein